MGPGAALGVVVVVAALVAGCTDRDSKESIRARSRASTSGTGPPIASANTVAGLFTTPVPFPGVVWTRNGSPVPTTELMAAAGPDHCGWESATLLTIRWPPGTDARTAAEARQYVRDPHSVLPPPDSRGALELNATLPTDAEPTGHESNGIKVYTAPSDAEAAIYLLGEDATERWPRRDPMVRCR